MRNVSIRTRILGGVVIVNLLGALAVIVYLHQSYSGDLDVTAEKSLKLARSSWEQLIDVGANDVGDIKTGAKVGEYLGRMKEITGADYGLLIDKSGLDAEAYGASREKAGQPNNWDERDSYVLTAATDEAAAELMQFGVAPGDVPEIGRMVGIGNGACSQMCHDGVKGEGDYWGVRWSIDSKSRTHVVFPVNDSAGKPVGVVYAIDDITAQADAAKGSMLRTLAVIGLTLVIATIVIGGMLDTWVFKRLSRMIISMEDLSMRVAGGDFDAHFDASGSNDEIGQFEQFFSRFMDLVSATLKSMLHKSA